MCLCLNPRFCVGDLNPCVLWVLCKDWTEAGLTLPLRCSELWPEDGDLPLQVGPPFLRPVEGSGQHRKGCPAPCLISLAQTFKDLPTARCASRETDCLLRLSIGVGRCLGLACEKRPKSQPNKKSAPEKMKDIDRFNICKTTGSKKNDGKCF